MRILLIGSGGREHALAWCISKSPIVSKIYCAPGNPGIAPLSELVDLKVDQIDNLVDFARRENVGLTVVGPEYPLSLGIVDKFRAAGLRIFGPTQAAALIESSKVFAKSVMKEAGVATADYAEFTDLDSAREYVTQKGAPIVIKADGLAAGKGVFVCQTQDEALSALQEIYRKYTGMKVLIEEYLTGKEASFIVAARGEKVITLAASHDYKRIFDGDRGPNTGGMGTVSPTLHLSPDQEQKALEEIIRPVLARMNQRGTPYCGFLYAGLMVMPDGSLKVLEFNARLGDPETQVILRRCSGDFLLALNQLLDDAQPKTGLEWSSNAAVCVVLASEGYPESSSSGDVIEGIDQAEAIGDVVVFHAGTSSNDRGELVTAGGRVLNVTALGADISAARALAYRACDKIRFRGKQFRRDIAG